MNLKGLQPLQATSTSCQACTTLALKELDILNAIRKFCVIIRQLTVLAKRGLKFIYTRVFSS